MPLGRGSKCRIAIIVFPVTGVIGPAEYLTIPSGPPPNASGTTSTPQQLHGIYSNIPLLNRNYYYTNHKSGIYIQTLHFPCIKIETHTICMSISIIILYIVYDRVLLASILYKLTPIRFSFIANTES